MIIPRRSGIGRSACGETGGARYSPGSSPPLWPFHPRQESARDCARSAPGWPGSSTPRSASAASGDSTIQPSPSARRACAVCPVPRRPSSPTRWRTRPSSTRRRCGRSTPGGTVRRVQHTLKYGGRPSLGQPLGRLMGSGVPRDRPHARRGRASPTLARPSARARLQPGRRPGRRRCGGAWNHRRSRSPGPNAGHAEAIGARARGTARERGRGLRPPRGRQRSRAPRPSWSTTCSRPARRSRAAARVLDRGRGDRGRGGSRPRRGVAPRWRRPPPFLVSPLSLWERDRVRVQRTGTRVAHRLLTPPARHAGGRAQPRRHRSWRRRRSFGDLQ